MSTKSTVMIQTPRRTVRRPTGAGALALLLAVTWLLATPVEATARQRAPRRRPAPRVLASHGAIYGGWYGPRYPMRYGPAYDASGVRLKLRPRDAAVFVDGYYAGIVDDFDGAFQHLALSPGGHRIEIRMPGYQTATADLHIQPGRTLTYHTDLVPDRP